MPCCNVGSSIFIRGEGMAFSKWDEAKIDRVVAHMRRTRSILFITGAGLSADSNLPTYRGIGGLYNDIETEDGMPIEMLLSGQTLARKPALTWKYISQVEEACRHAAFNRGHAVIAEMESHFQRLCVLTQNVDGFHHDAGSTNVIEIHGNLHQLLCTACGTRRVVSTYEGLDLPPACESCSGIMRPDVVLFGEMIPHEKITALQNATEIGFGLVFSIGTTSAFEYIARPVINARTMGIPTVEINPSDTEVSIVVEIKLPTRAAETLDAIWSRFLTDPS